MNEKLVHKTRVACVKQEISNSRGAHSQRTTTNVAHEHRRLFTHFQRERGDQQIRVLALYIAAIEILSFKRGIVPTTRWFIPIQIVHFMRGYGTSLVGLGHYQVLPMLLPSCTPSLEMVANGQSSVVIQRPLHNNDKFAMTRTHFSW